MKAIVYTKYGPPEVLQLKEVKRPVPRENEILVKIYASSVNYGDITVRNFRYLPLSKFNMPLPFWFMARLMFGFWKPKKNIPGSEFAGNIEATGENVKSFKAGDPVFGYLGPRMGANAEYVCVNEKSMVAIKPENMNYEEASILPYGGTTAFHLLRNINIKKGDKVLINGASGAIGSHAVQLAKHYGAEVTGVCGTPRMEFVKSLGADKVIDYTKEDFAQKGETYDLIFDILGKSTFSRCKNSLKSDGVYLRASFKMRELFQMLWTKFFSSKKVICALTTEKKENLVRIKELVEAGKIKSVIDKFYPLEKTVEAHRYVEEGNKKGNVLITIGNN